MSDQSEGAVQASCRIKILWLATCYPDIDVVDDKDFTILPPTGQTISAISIGYKQGVKFLPKNLFSAFPNLSLFEMSGCSVTSVNKNHFEKLSKLELLDLANNRIENVTSDAFVDLVSLENLNLNDNKIQFLDKNTFASLKSLKDLRLWNNEIQFSDENIFKSLNNLEFIDFSGNKLQKLPKKLFKNNLKLKTVNLYDNQIKCIYFNFFNHLPKLENVLLKKNFCINLSYNETSFDAMKRDLKTNCSCTDTSCGVPKHSLELIVRGQSFERGAFPWVVALMHTGWRPPKFFCAGTLISKTFVVSAAHCILRKGAIEKFLPRDMIAIFGAHDLANSYELGRILQSPKKIFIHDDWNHLTASFDADISLLEFEEGTMQFSNYIQPICLMETETNPTVTQGVVIGWGRSEDKSKDHENLPKLVSALIQPNEDCWLEEGKLLPMSSKRTFCAGLRNGSGVCSGDSGGGFFIKINEVYHLKGIVSSSLIADHDCDISRDAIYTKVLKFKDWINEKINGAEGRN